ncbi:hypothetical protein NP493_2341g00027 [Ridgeia piscesae]|uniref:Uncharacterized protein n=1 Tax=Ridgeia piscesae TaxID=27915 RepID=A0AAD9N2M2_RIDPI|nr:hypothetical protein NP493_2341g00027 [Ridgeia piscesae]
MRGCGRGGWERGSGGGGGAGGGGVRCGAVRGGAVRCGAVRCGAVRCGAVRCGAVRCVLFYNVEAAWALRNVFKGYPKTSPELQQTTTWRKQPADNPTGNARD